MPVWGSSLGMLSRKGGCWVSPSLWLGPRYSYLSRLDTKVFILQMRLQDVQNGFNTEQK